MHTPNRIQRPVLHPRLLPAIRHGCADGTQARVFLVEAAQAAGSEILLGLDLQGDDGAGQLEQEVDLAGAMLGGPIIGRDADLGDQLLEDVLLRQRALELDEYIVAAQEGAHVDVAHGGQQAHVQEIQLEGSEIVIGFQRHARLGDAMDPVDQAAIGQPLQRDLKVLGPGSLPEHAVDELPVLLRQLGRDGLPYHAQPGDDVIGGVLGEVLLIGRQQRVLYGAHLGEVAPLDVGGHGLRHPADVIVLAQQVDVFGFEGGDQRPVQAIQQVHQWRVFRRQQELPEAERIQLQLVHLAHGEVGPLVHGDPQQRSRRDHRILRRVLIEVADKA